MGSSRRSRLSPDAIVGTREGSAVRALKLAFPIGNQVGAGNVVDGELVRPTVTSDLHPAILGRAEGPGKIASPLHPVVEPYTSALPHESRKVPLSPQGPIKPGRAHFKLIRMRNMVGDIQGRRYVATHPFTVLVGHACPASFRCIDEKAQHRPRLLATKHDFDEIEAGVADVGFSEQPQVLKVLSHGGFWVKGLGNKKRRARGPPFEKEATQSSRPRFITRGSWRRKTRLPPQNVRIGEDF
jgi:hypothetical protein